MAITAATAVVEYGVCAGGVWASWARTLTVARVDHWPHLRSTLAPHLAHAQLPARHASPCCGLGSPGGSLPLARACRCAAACVAVPQSCSNGIAEARKIMQDNFRAFKGNDDLMNYAFTLWDVIVFSTCD